MSYFSSGSQLLATVFAVTVISLLFITVLFYIEHRLSKKTIKIPMKIILGKADILKDLILKT